MAPFARIPVPPLEGVYTLTATTRNRTAHVPPPDQQDTACTSFTGELRDLIRSGIPGKPPLLTFSDIYPALRQRLLAKGLPAPSQRGTDTAHQFPFTANAAALLGPDTRPEANGAGETARKNPDPGQTDRARATRILNDALRVAQSITDEGSKALALARVAGAMAATDPDRAARLITDAERVAQSITGEYWKAEALASVAGAMAATDPDRAARLIADAERITQSITSKDFKTPPLVRSMPLVGSIAERIVLPISFSLDHKAEALASVAEAVAATDPDRAERLAQPITHEGSMAWVLIRIAKAVAATDPDRAERPPASWDSRRACCQHNRQWPSLTASTRPHPEHCCSPG